MALAYPTYPTVLRATFVDHGGNKSTKDYWVPTSVWNPASDVLADLVTIRGALATALGNVSNALIATLAINIIQNDNAAIIGPAGSEVAELANLVCPLETAPLKSTLQIPAPKDALFLNDGGTPGEDFNTIDKTDAAVLAYLALFQTTGGSFVIGKVHTIDDTTPILSGKRTHRGTSNG